MYKIYVMISGGFDDFSCWEVSAERFLIDLYVKVCVFAGGCVCLCKAVEMSQNTIQNKNSIGYSLSR